jgi:hypothetical protein
VQFLSDREAISLIRHPEGFLEPSYVNRGIGEISANGPGHWAKASPECSPTVYVFKVAGYLPADENGAIMSLLKISGTKIVNEKGEEVILRGAGLGGWMKCVQLYSKRPKT